MNKYVYFFGNGHAEGNATMVDLLGGKGAGLAEMSALGLPVPPGFTITTEVCRYYGEHKQTFPEDLKEQVETAIRDLERMTGQKLGDSKNPLAVSVRSGASRSMPGMMDTMLNVDDTTDLWSCIESVFLSWNNPLAVNYRRIEKIPSNLCTAATIQAMVFGNAGDDSATGVAFTRNPGTGENQFYGEYLLNAQGEDVVSGTRTPGPINAYSKSGDKNLPTLEDLMPDMYRELCECRTKLEKHYRDMLDIEFTIQKGKLYILQCRVGKRNGIASLRIAVEMLREGLITVDEALNRVTREHLAELKAPIVDPEAENNAEVLALGLPAGPGGATGKAVFSPKRAIKMAKNGDIILVREETSPDDVEGMYAAKGTLTQKGGMTSHAATVARGWGKCCIVGCDSIEVGLRQFKTKSGKTIHEEDWITLNGTTGVVYKGRLKLNYPSLELNPYYAELMLRKRQKDES